MKDKERKKVWKIKQGSEGKGREGEVSEEENMKEGMESRRREYGK